MNLTCKWCIDARQWRCIGPGCARWERTHTRPKLRATTARKRKPQVYVPTGRPRGRPLGSSTLPLPMQRAVADALIEGVSKAEIARRSGATYEQVRTVQRQLHALGEETQCAA